MTKKELLDELTILVHSGMNGENLLKCFMSIKDTEHLDKSTTDAGAFITYFARRMDLRDNPALTKLLLSAERKNITSTESLERFKRLPKWIDLYSADTAQNAPNGIVTDTSKINVTWTMHPQSAMLVYMGTDGVLKLDKEVWERKPSKLLYMRIRKEDTLFMDWGVREDGLYFQETIVLPCNFGKVFRITTAPLMLHLTEQEFAKVVRSQVLTKRQRFLQWLKEL